MNNLTVNVGDFDFGVFRRTYGNVMLGNLGCIESIVHYSMMLLKDHSAEVDVGQLTAKTRRLLGELEVQDYFRSQRYRELG